MITGQELQKIANAQRSGYLKTWKAYGIAVELHDFPIIVEDNIRLTNYLTSCLEMEGFTSVGIEAVMRYIKENY